MKLAKKPLSKKPTKIENSEQALLRDLREIITSGRAAVARTVNSALVMIYWQIGQRIQQGILQGKRAEYGEEILPRISSVSPLKFYCLSTYGYTETMNLHSDPVLWTLHFEPNFFEACTVNPAL